jgi:hypothetical protein
MRGQHIIGENLIIARGSATSAQTAKLGRLSRV